MKGQAADIRVDGMAPDELARAIVGLGLPFDQVIVEPSWVHVSHKVGANRGRALQKTGSGYAVWTA